MGIRLVLADHHPIILDGLENLFQQEPDFKVLARCTTAEQTLQAVRQHNPDVLFLDLEMPARGGLAIARQIADEKLPAHIVLVTRALREDDLLEAVRLGVSGIVLEEMAPHLFVQCARKVSCGEQWLEMKSFGRALEKLLRREAAARAIAKILTPREIEIVRMVAAGLRNKEIATRLFISEGTVKSHLHSIFEKLRVSGRQELIGYAKDNDLVT
jgi:DNA-binding NarL/FixJ family response regulator